MPLNPLLETDLSLILPWRNAPAVRRAMYSHQVISPDEHRAWFDRLRGDSTRRWYLYRDHAGEPRGVVNFTQLSTAQRTAFWGFYASPDASAGTGTHILYEAIELAFGELGLRKLNGEVLATNSASINLHKKVGFTQEGLFRAQHFDGNQNIDVIRFGLLLSEWTEHRVRLRNFVEQHCPECRLSQNYNPS